MSTHNVCFHGDISKISTLVGKSALFGSMFGSGLKSQEAEQ